MRNDRRYRAVLIACCLVPVALAFLGTASAATPDTNQWNWQFAIPYVPTHSDIVKDMLWLADVGTNDVVYDLGSGDGRIVIAAVRDFHARMAVGIEINPELVRQSRENAAQAGIADRVQFIQGDLFTNDFSAATVVTLYLGADANLRLRPKIFRTLQPGARVVSHEFGMGEWLPDKILDVRPPSSGQVGMFGTLVSSSINLHDAFRGNSDVPDYWNYHTAALWKVPARVAGTWRGKLQTAVGEQELVLVLHQNLAGAYGDLQNATAPWQERISHADVWGDHLLFNAWSPGARKSTQPNYIGETFNGAVTGDELKGSLWIPGGGPRDEYLWIAHREKVDLTGVWEWTGSSNAGPQQVWIENKDGRLTAQYNGKALHDFYDFGGGFYFTIFLEGDPGIRIGQGQRLTMVNTGITVTKKNESMGNGPVVGLYPGNQQSFPDSGSAGWLVGEAIIHGDHLDGTLEYYPFKENAWITSDFKREPQEWHAQRLTP